MAGPDLQIRGAGGHPDLELRGGWFPKYFLGPSGVSFRSKNIGEEPGPSPGSATAYKPVFRTFNCCELRGIQSSGGPKFRHILLNKNWAKNYYRHSV